MLKGIFSGERAGRHAEREEKAASGEGVPDDEWAREKILRNEGAVEGRLGAEKSGMTKRLDGS